FQIELPSAVMLNEIEFTASASRPSGPGTPPNWTSPRRYQVQVSSDGAAWSTPVAEGAGADASTTTITFAPVSAKVIRITQTAAVPGAPPWSMRLLRLYESRR